MGKSVVRLNIAERVFDGLVVARVRVIGIALITTTLMACGGGGGGSTTTANEASVSSSAVVDTTTSTTDSTDTSEETETTKEEDTSTPVDPEPDTSGGSVAPETIVQFESGPVRTLALSPSGKRLFVTNIPDGKLEILDVIDGKLSLLASVPVGLEPVAVAARSDDEAWVVNHLSDSVSIVRIQDQKARVVKTLQLGDEPRDIVFDAQGRAYVTASYRGQNHPTFHIDDLKKPGLGRADVWVFDAEPTSAPLTIINLFADSPRALAVSADGNTVYAAAFLSGNQTTTILNTPQANAAKQAPIENVEGIKQPDTGLIVGFDGQKWVDDGGTDFSAEVMFELPDYDVFVIDARPAIPTLVKEISGVGTVLFNMTANPSSGALYVSNTEARNRVRFEGNGSLSTTVRGHVVENRITVINDGGVQPLHLNAHVDFTRREGDPIAAADKALSLAQPMDMVVDSTGKTLYLAAFSSNKIAAIDTAALESGDYVPEAGRQLLLPGGAPAGLALAPDDSKLFVFTRYDNRVSVIDTATFTVESSIGLYNPEPDAFKRGRRFLYDADLTSSNGTNSCGSCHIFGDVDGLAWDLGDPEGMQVLNRNPFVPGIDSQFPLGSSTFHPMKGPMTTQTFRGIADSGPMHWRGDRTGENRATVNGQLESLEAAAFKEFNHAFVGLLGREDELAPDQLQDFTDFSLAIKPPPNPIRALNNALSPRQQAGLDDYRTVKTTAGLFTCNHCHELDVSKNHFGTSGLMTTEGAGITEQFKVVHLRNVYSKVGMFGANRVVKGVAPEFMGPQIKGFGHLHDGAIDSIENFLNADVFNLTAPQLDRITALVFAFDTNYAPILGQQITIGSQSTDTELDRLQLLVNRARISKPRPECDLIAKGIISDESRGAVMNASGTFTTDRSEDPDLSLERLLELSSSPGQEITFTCVAPGTGERLGIDRNLDGIRDGDR